MTRRIEFNQLEARVDALEDSPPGSAAWGDIGGTITDQADLQDALDDKANLASPTFTGTVGGITKSMVGLGNVDNTSDANKPVSTATQTALNLKADLASPTFTGTVAGISKSMVGLGNVDNTSDANKPVSTATQTALDLKANLASPTFTGTVSGITAAMVGAQPVDSDLTTIAGLTATTDNIIQSVGSAWASRTPTQVKTALALNNVDNTSDASKPVSTATQAALDLKANTILYARTSGTRTTTTTALANVTDLSVPVSTSQVWNFDCYLFGGCNNTGGSQFAITVPTSATMRMQATGNTNAANAFTTGVATSSDGVSPTFYTISSGGRTVELHGVVRTAGTSGTIQVRFKSVTSTQTTTVDTDSYMIARLAT